MDIDICYLAFDRRDEGLTNPSSHAHSFVSHRWRRLLPRCVIPFLRVPCVTCATRPTGQAVRLI